GGRGTGLPSTVRAVTRLGGYLYLASGAAASMITRQRTANSAGDSFAGTIVEGRVPTRRLTPGTSDAWHDGRQESAGGDHHGERSGSVSADVRGRPRFR